MTTREPEHRTTAHTRVRDIQRELVAEVERHEAAVEERLPAECEPVGLGDRLKVPVHRRADEQKSSRAVPAILAYEAHLDCELPAAVLRVLTGLDIAIMAIDDLVDANPTDRDERTTLAGTVVLSCLLSFASVPSESRERVVGELSRYLVETAQIPAIERHTWRVRERSLATEFEQHRRSYACRARDIDGFGTIPGIVVGVDCETRDRIVRDLRTYRARSILFDDLGDIERDRANGDETPISWLIETYEPEYVAERIATLWDAFEYSEASAASYRTQLRDAEPNPDDVERLLGTIQVPDDG